MTYAFAILYKKYYLLKCSTFFMSSICVLDSSVLKLKCVQANLCLKPQTLEEAKKHVGAPSITFVGDVSGSMKPNMEALLNSILALIDMAGSGSTLRIILFDEEARTVLPFTTLSQTNTLEIKDQMKGSVINYGKSTNLELALQAVLGIDSPPSPSIPASQPTNPQPHSEPKAIDKVFERSLTLFASDGMANRGRQSSSDLLQFARAFPSYGQQTFYTLGIKTDPFAELNSELLKDLSLDSCGSFFLTQHSEGIAQSIGDLLADHYFVQYTHLLPQCTSANGHSGILRTRMSPRGATLRSDKSIQFTWEFPLDAQEPYELVHSRKNRLGVVEEHKEILVPTPANVKQIEQILGCVIVAPALDKVFSKSQVSEKLVLLKDFAIKSSISEELKGLIKSLVECLENFDCGKEQAAEVSWHSYAMSSGGGAEVSLHANELRQSAVLCSQAQEDLDSQQTVESESTKRFRSK